METTDERHGVEEDTVRRSVRVVVVGDAGCGKTSLIYTYTRSQFYKDVVKVLPEIRLPSLHYLLYQETILIDTMAEEVLRDKTREAVEAADVVVLLCKELDYSEEDEVVRWIKFIRSDAHFKHRIVVARNRFKYDPEQVTEDEDPESFRSFNRAVTEKLFKIYPKVSNIAYVGEVNVKKEERVAALFRIAVTEVVLPVYPLLDEVNLQLKQQYLCALTRIFFLFDIDNDGFLDDFELSLLQFKVYEVSLRYEDILGIKELLHLAQDDAQIVDEFLKYAGNKEDRESIFLCDDKITLLGFFALYKLFLLDHNLAACWLMLRKTEHDDNLKLTVDLVSLSHQIKKHGSTAQASFLGGYGQSSFPYVADFLELNDRSQRQSRSLGQSRRLVLTSKALDFYSRLYDAIPGFRPLLQELSSSECSPRTNDARAGMSSVFIYEDFVLALELFIGISPEDLLLLVEWFEETVPVTLWLMLQQWKDMGKKDKQPASILKTEFIEFVRRLSLLSPAVSLYLGRCFGFCNLKMAQNMKLQLRRQPIEMNANKLRDNADVLLSISEYFEELQLGETIGHANSHVHLCALGTVEEIGSFMETLLFFHGEATTEQLQQLERYLGTSDKLVTDPPTCLLSLKTLFQREVGENLDPPDEAHSLIRTQVQQLMNGHSLGTRRETRSRTCVFSLPTDSSSSGDEAVTTEIVLHLCVACEKTLEMALVIPKLPSNPFREVIYSPDLVLLLPSFATPTFPSSLARLVSDHASRPVGETVVFRPLRYCLIINDINYLQQIGLTASPATADSLQKLEAIWKERESLSETLQLLQPMKFVYLRSRTHVPLHSLNVDQFHKVRVYNTTVLELLYEVACRGPERAHEEALSHPKRRFPVSLDKISLLNDRRLFFLLIGSGFALATVIKLRRILWS